MTLNFKEMGYESFTEYLLDKTVSYQERLQAAYDELPLDGALRKIATEGAERLSEGEAEKIIRDFAYAFEKLPDVLNELEAALHEHEKNKG